MRPGGWKEAAYSDGALGELDRLLHVEPVKVDGAARLSLVVLVEDPVGGLIVVLLLEALVLLALDREVVRTSTIASRVSLLARGKSLALFECERGGVSIARDQGRAQPSNSARNDRRTIRSPSWIALFLRST